MKLPPYSPYVMVFLAFGVLCLVPYHIGSNSSPFKGATKVKKAGLTFVDTSSPAVNMTKERDCLCGVLALGLWAGGRLGNALAELATGWALARLCDCGLHLVAGDALLKQAAQVLSRPPATALSAFLIGLRRSAPAPCAARAATRLARAAARAPAVPQLALAHGAPAAAKWLRAAAGRGPVVLRRYTMAWGALAAMRDALRREFRYSDELESYAQATLSQVAAPLRSAWSDRTVQFVGVHARRTDYPAYLRRRFGANFTAVAGAAFFARALERLAHAIPPLGPPPLVLAVLVCSDDATWAKRKLVPALRAAADALKPQVRAAVAWAGSPWAARDLAVLSRCNHSALAYGSFGAWAALQAGGAAVVFDVNGGRRRPAGAAPRDTNAMALAHAMPGWELLA